MFDNLMRKFVVWLDPKLEDYREHEPVPDYTPSNIEEFVDIMRRTPKSILSAKDRKRIASIMSFDDHRVKDLMTEAEKMVFVNERDMLGPLMLDQLYKSGFKHFPVIDKRGKVVGVLHTEALNALETKETERADHIMDEKVFYLRDADTLQTAADEFVRTNACYFLIKNNKDETVGFLTLEMFLHYLIG